MEARIEKLEDFVVATLERLAKIETRLDQTATKTDLAEEVGALRVEMHKGFGEMIRLVVGTAIVLGAAAITVITFVLNYATPPKNLAQQLAQPAPIIIQLPPYPVPVPRQ
jgi:hypothetical protein